MQKRRKPLLPVAIGESSPGTGCYEAHINQTTTQSTQPPTPSLIERIASIPNLRRAFHQVKRNRGAPGVDEISIRELEDDLEVTLAKVSCALVSGIYSPQPVLAREIPKANGKTRKLGIPTVKDRIVQQACVQVLSPIFDVKFSQSSYGFKPKRSAHQAIKRACEYVAGGKDWVVDIDLENFFENVNHDMIMGRVAREIQDMKVIKLIRRFLNAGIMEHGVKVATEQGTPQGGPLSPLLSNILLHDLDEELERREHSFCRYADDCNIYVASESAANRVFTTISIFLEKKLRLKVNREKSAATKVCRRKISRCHYRVGWQNCAIQGNQVQGKG